MKCSVYYIQLYILWTLFKKFCSMTVTDHWPCSFCFGFGQKYNRACLQKPNLQQYNLAVCKFNKFHTQSRVFVCYLRFNLYGLKIEMIYCIEITLPILECTSTFWIKHNKYVHKQFSSRLGFISNIAILFFWINTKIQLVKNELFERYLFTHATTKWYLGMRIHVADNGIVCV